MEYILRNKDVFVAYRLPNQDYHVLLQPSNNKAIPFDELKENAPAFIFHPFKEHPTTPALAIPADKLHINPKFHFKSEQDGQPFSIHPMDYIPLLEQFIQHIGKGEAHKIICSRVIRKEIKMENLYPLFIRLKKEYPQAFVYLINIPNVGCWMGATPEVLLTQHHAIGETVALAGTRPASDTSEWGEKEVIEQQMVEKYMSDILIHQKKSFQKTGPFTAQAGNIVHLKTRFRFPLKDNWKEIAMDIHPSPAICGLPKQEAEQFILDHEPHNREYYCGFLGTVNMNEKTDLFVNLRCMQVFQNHVALYVGGGITKDSIPQKELEETRWKSRTLSDILEEVYKQEIV